jgi:DoxX-like family
VFGLCFGYGWQEYLARVSHPIRARRLHGESKQPEKKIGVPVFAAYVVVTLMAIAANAFSGVAALVHFGPILPGMIKAGVPESWLTTLGALKTAGAVGLLLGLIGVPLIGTAAAVGLVLFFVGAIITHLRARDYGQQFGLAVGFFLLAASTLVLSLAS